MRRTGGASVWALLLVLALLLGGCQGWPESVSPPAAPSPTAPLVAALPTAFPPAPASPSSPTPTSAPTATPVPSATPTSTPPPSPTIVPSQTATASRTPAPPSVDGTAAWAHVTHLAGTLGSRQVGSPGARAAADYLAAQLAGLGYEVERQRFPYQTYVEEESWLRVEVPRPMNITTRALRYAPSGEARGPLVDVGLGRAQDLAGKDLTGKIALAQRGEISFQEKAGNAARAGAAALVISNDQTGPLGGQLSETRGVPVLGITQEDGMLLRSLLAGGEVVVQAGLRARTEAFGGQNILATRQGAEERLLVISAHYDSVEVPGANDNASGVAVALEVARVLAQRPQRLTVQIALYDAEEVGLVGSRYHVDALRQQGRPVVADLNLDMVGVGPDLLLYGTEPLLGRALALGQTLGLNPSKLTDNRALSSDHASFMAAGLPALFVHRGPDPNYHTPADQPARVTPAALADSGRLALALVEMLSAD